jgi:uncharacterized protein YeeX (DUF496 family)
LGAFFFLQGVFMRSAINALLVVLSLMVSVLASVSVKASCPIGIENKGVSWDWSKYGNAPYVCGNSCKSVLKDVSVCFPDAERCTGDFVTDGNPCSDSDGMVAGGSFPEPDNGGGDNGGGDNGGGDGDSDMPASFDAIEYAVKTNMDRYSDEQYMALSSLEAARWSVQTFKKLEQLRTEHFADMDSALNTIKVKTNSMEGKMDSINTKASNIATSTSSTATNLHEIKNKLDQLIENTTPEEEPDCTPRPFPELPPPECIPRPSGVEKRLDGINNTLINNAVTDTIMSQEIKASIEGMKNDNNSRLDTLNESLGSLESSGDANSQAEISAINGVGNKVDGLGGKLSSISQGIGAIRDALSPGDYQQRDAQGKVDFESLPLYGQTAIDELEAETEQLKQDYDDKVKEFRQLFSFDTSKLNEGEYVEHSMTLTLANGRQASAKSGVFPALVDNSALIAAVILFLAAVIGSRFIF